MLQIENLSKTFDDGSVALHDINLRVEEGEFVVLLGPSGSGKTSLIRCINGLLTPDNGKVEFKGKECFNEHLQRLRNELGTIFQDFNLVDNLTALNNVLTGLLFESSILPSMFYIFKKNQKLKALSVLKRVGLLQKAHTRVSYLSGGEKQRVGIARAIVKKPSLLLADEPVASLDPVISLKIMTLLRDLCKEFGITVVCSLHQVGLAFEVADRIVGLSEGKIVIDDQVDNIKEENLQLMYGGSSESLKFL